MFRYYSSELNIDTDILNILFADEIDFISKMGLWSVFIAFMTYDKDDRSSSTPTPHLFLTFLSF